MNSDVIMVDAFLNDGVLFRLNLLIKTFIRYLGDAIMIMIVVTAILRMKRVIVVSDCYLMISQRLFENMSSF